MEIQQLFLGILQLELLELGHQDLLQLSLVSLQLSSLDRGEKLGLLILREALLVERVKEAAHPEGWKW